MALVASRWAAGLLFGLAPRDPASLMLGDCRARERESARRVDSRQACGTRRSDRRAARRMSSDQWRKGKRALRAGRYEEYGGSEEPSDARHLYLTKKAGQRQFVPGTRRTLRTDKRFSVPLYLSSVGVSH